MSDALDPKLEHVLGALEAEWLDPSSATEEEIEAWLGRRQDLLGRIQSIDAGDLDPTLRAQIQARLRKVTERDQQLVLALQARMQMITDRLGNAAQGRAAVRGYRSPEDTEAKLFVRPA